MIRGRTAPKIASSRPYSGPTSSAARSRIRTASAGAMPPVPMAIVRSPRRRIAGALQSQYGMSSTVLTSTCRSRASVAIARSVARSPVATIAMNASSSTAGSQAPPVSRRPGDAVERRPSSRCSGAHAVTRAPSAQQGRDLVRGLAAPARDHDVPAAQVEEDRVAERAGGRRGWAGSSGAAAARPARRSASRRRPHAAWPRLDVPATRRAARTPGCCRAPPTTSGRSARPRPAPRRGCTARSRWTRSPRRGACCRAGRAPGCSPRPARRSSRPAARPSRCSRWRGRGRSWASPAGLGLVAPQAGDPAAGALQRALERQHLAHLAAAQPVLRRAVEQVGATLADHRLDVGGRPGRMTSMSTPNRSRTRSIRS